MSLLPIVLYNDPVLRANAAPVTSITPELTRFIADLFETMYHAHGVGLAAPQVGQSIRLFVVDADAMVEDEPDAVRYGRKVYINPEIVSKGDKSIEFEEGCLSIPDLRETIRRPDTITVRYRDEEFVEQTVTYSGWMSRVFQHELDHLDGTLFIDRVGSFRRRLLTRKLDLIDKGSVEPEYPFVPRSHG
jgi:peptide deformylase